MWISAPMPVTTRIIVADSTSSRRSKATRNAPTVIHSATCWITSRDSAGADMSSPTTATARANEATTADTASHPAHRPSRPPKNRFTAAASNGSTGTSHSSEIAPEAGTATSSAPVDITIEAISRRRR